MNRQKQEEISLKVSYYCSYKEFAIKGGLAYWPFFVVLILMILTGLVAGSLSVTMFFLFLVYL